MNIIDLKKKFQTAVISDWRDNTDTINHLNIKDKERIINVIDFYKDKKSIKEIAIVKYEGLPIFVTIQYTEFVQLLKLIKRDIIKNQLYELASKVRVLETYLEDPISKEKPIQL
jgi:hypothetical protein